MKQNLSYYQERNQKIFQERKSGKTYREIGKKYGISASRVKQIVERKTVNQKTKNIRQKIIDKRDFYSALVMLSENKDFYTKFPIGVLFVQLRRAGIIEQLENDIYAIDEYSDKDLLKIKYIGKSYLKVIREANEIYKKWHENE